MSGGVPKPEDGEPKPEGTADQGTVVVQGNPLQAALVAARCADQADDRTEAAAEAALKSDDVVLNVADVPEPVASPVSAPALVPAAPPPPSVDIRRPSVAPPPERRQRGRAASAWGGDDDSSPRLDNGHVVRRPAPGSVHATAGSSLLVSAPAQPPGGARRLHSSTGRVGAARVLLGAVPGQKKRYTSADYQGPSGDAKDDPSAEVTEWGVPQPPKKMVTFGQTDELEQRVAGGSTTTRPHVGKAADPKCQAFQRWDSPIFIAGVISVAVTLAFTLHTDCSDWVPGFVGGKKSQGAAGVAFASLALVPLLTWYRSRGKELARISRVSRVNPGVAEQGGSFGPIDVETACMTTIALGIVSVLGSLPTLLDQLGGHYQYMGAYAGTHMSEKHLAAMLLTASTTLTFAMAGCMTSIATDRSWFGGCLVRAKPQVRSANRGRAGSGGSDVSTHSQPEVPKHKLGPVGGGTGRFVSTGALAGQPPVANPVMAAMAAQQTQQTAPGYVPPTVPGGK